MSPELRAQRVGLREGRRRDYGFGALAGEAWGDGVECEWEAYEYDGCSADRAWAREGGGAEGVFGGEEVRCGVGQSDGTRAGDLCDCGVWGCGRDRGQFEGVELWGCGGEDYSRDCLLYTS